MSGALVAGRYRMDIVGFALIGTITGFGGGTLRDLLLGRTVWWTQDPLELILCIVVSLLTFFVIPSSVARRNWMTWCDAMGLAAFSVVGCHIALSVKAPLVVAVFMGMLTATGGGVVRDVLTGTKPMITSGQLYATAALTGATCYRHGRRRRGRQERRGRTCLTENRQNNGRCPRCRRGDLL